jgi:hypothetical protein
MRGRGGFFHRRVMGALEPNAIASGIADRAHRRVGKIVTLVCDWLGEQGNPLNQSQKVELHATALRCMDGFERDVVDDLVVACERIRIA